MSLRMVLGDIVNIDMIHDLTIDLLNENITIEAALKLSALAKEAVEFLKQGKVSAKTLEPDFCHAKIYRVCIVSTSQSPRQSVLFHGQLVCPPT